LLLLPGRRNKKLTSACAEPVEDESSLWKAMEKAREIRHNSADKIGQKKKAQENLCPSAESAAAFSP
jgi:hypothetical protein